MTETGKKSQGRNTGIKNVDILKDGRETDIVIPIMGPTGAGKTTFINIALQEDRLKVGHTVNSSTSQVFPIVIDPIPDFPALNGRRLVLVDTPGFDDTFVDDVQILKQIAKWLADSYRKGMTIGGVLYLHDISIKRFNGTAHKNLDMFRHLCGEAALNKVVLSTTSWAAESGDSKVHERREEELRTVHWKSLIEQGAVMRRFMRDRNSAWDIIKVFLERLEANQLPTPVQRPTLLIQTELVVRRMRIPETEAGQALLGTLQRTLETHQKITELEAAVAEGRGPEAKAKLDEARADIVKLKAQIRASKLSLPQRVLKWIGLN